MSTHGHLFVMQGDLTRLAADDFIVPCDERQNVTLGFADLIGPHEPGDWAWVRPRKTTRVRGSAGLWRVDTNDAPGPRVWLLDTTAKAGGVKGLAERLSRALAVVEKVAAPPLNGRARRIVALPLVGIGEGGFAGHHGETLEALLTTLRDTRMSEGAPDVALVLHNRADYAVIQQQRTKAQLSRSERSTIARLATAVREGQLVLFLGAGVSAAAGMPSWDQLLRRLLSKSRVPESEHESILRLPAPDAADCLRGTLSDEGLAKALLVELGSDHHALAHGLLASLRVPEVVTTNFDSLFERAATTPYEGKLAVLPMERLRKPRPWLLKLHGDLAYPKSIVLTREQYLKFDSTSAPLAAIVQAGMVSKHVLFCGYSLSDDNFIRLARQVRDLFKQRGDGTVSKVGTVLTLFRDPGRERLWREDVHFLATDNGVSPSDAESRERRTAESARRLEILLDALAQQSCAEASYLLDEKFDFLLSKQEHQLADALRGIPRSAVAGSSPSAVAVRRLLSSLGSGDHEWASRR